MKRLVILKALLLVIFFSVISLANQSTVLCGEPIKIGILRDLSGGLAEGGISQLDAQKMIFDEINEKGGILGHKIDYTVGDEKCDPDRATSLTRRFIDVDNVLLISGPTCSGSGLAMMKVASEEGVPAMGHAESVKLQQGEIGKWYFGSGTDSEEFMKAQLVTVKRDGIKEVAIVWVNYAWGREAKDIVYKYSKDYGISVLGDVPVEMSASEATAEVSKIRDMKPQAVMLCCLAKDQAAVARGFAALNWKPLIYGTSAVMEPSMRIVGPQLMEDWRGAFFNNPYDPAIQEVLKKFEAKNGHGTPAPTYFMETWDATNVLVNVFKTMIEKNIPLTRKELRDAMEKYSGGVDLLTPMPRKSVGWGTQLPHDLIRAEDLVPLKIQSGKLIKY